MAPTRVSARIGNSTPIALSATTNAASVNKTKVHFKGDKLSFTTFLPEL